MLGKAKRLSIYDILKLKKLYGCDTDECIDYYSTSNCEIFKAEGKCKDNLIKLSCRKTCDQCYTDEC